MRIYISITDEVLDFRSEIQVDSFEEAEQKLDQIKNSHARRVAMELKDDTVI